MGTNFPFIHAILSSRLTQLLAGPKPEDQAGLGAIIGIAQKIVAERFDPASESKDAKDMLNSFIKHGLTQLEAESESLLQILAGSDSTATTIRATFLYILTNPPVYAKLRAEIDEAIATGSVSFPVITNQEALQLPYLQACIKEGLRLWQPLNGIQTKVAPPEGVTINGVIIPGGTQVGLSQHNMMRRQDFFGPDADLFRPERWLTDPETVKAYERVWELSFAYGRFTCLGKGIALMELNKVFVEVRWPVLSVRARYIYCPMHYSHHNFAAVAEVRLWPRESGEDHADEMPPDPRPAEYGSACMATNRVNALLAEREGHLGVSD